MLALGLVFPLAWQGGFRVLGLGFGFLVGRKLRAIGCLSVSLLGGLSEVISGAIRPLIWVYKCSYPTYISTYTYLPMNLQAV